MKIYSLLIGAAMLGAVSCSAGNSDSRIKVTYADGLPHPDTLFVDHTLISEMLNAKSADDLHTEYDTVLWKDNAFVIPISEKGPSSYSFKISDVQSSEAFFTLYTQPGEKLTINLKSLSPVTFTASGSELLEGMAQIQEQEAPITKAYGELMKSGESDMEKIQALVTQYVDVNKNFIRQNPGNAAAVYALLELAGDDSYGEFYESLQEGAKKSPIYPFAEAEYAKFQQQQKAQETSQRLRAGATMAPDFKLKNLEGKEVSLSEFKGKWVILDFWGSWCRWCIKGFPELKKAYAKYHPQGLEVIGIDCGDTEEEWKAAVEKYELPWIQLYNGSDKSLTELYGIQGFPTKLIINPQGVVVNLTVGEDPAFFTELDGFMN